MFPTGPALSKRARIKIAVSPINNTAITLFLVSGLRSSFFANLAFLFLRAISFIVNLKRGKIQCMLKDKIGIFKAYDIRGRYPQEINEEVVSKITTVLADYFRSKVKRSLPAGRQEASKVIVVGYDARLSSPALYRSVLRSLKPKTYNLTPIPVGMITTPMLYFLVNHFKAAGGIMITASHNPKEYNGLKVVGSKAVPMSGEEIYKLISPDQRSRIRDNSRDNF